MKKLVGVDLVEKLPPTHFCDLPRGPLFRKSQWAGYVIRCSCTKKYVWKQRWSWYEYLGWGWDEYLG